MRENIEKKYDGNKPHCRDKVKFCMSIDSKIAARLKKHCGKEGRYYYWVIEKAIGGYLEKIEKR